MARHKSDANKDLPKYLSPEGSSGKYWRYSHPEVIKTKGGPMFFSETRERAIALVSAANEDFDRKAGLDLTASKPRKAKPGPQGKGSFFRACDNY